MPNIIYRVIIFMRNIKAVILLIAISAITLTTVFYGGVTLAFSDTISTAPIPSAPEETIIQKTETTSSEETSREETTAVLEKETALGLSLCYSLTLKR